MYFKLQYKDRLTSVHKRKKEVADDGNTAIVGVWPQALDLAIYNSNTSVLFFRVKDTQVNVSTQRSNRQVYCNDGYEQENGERVCSGYRVRAGIRGDNHEGGQRGYFLFVAETESNTTTPIPRIKQTLLNRHKWQSEQ